MPRLPKTHPTRRLSLEMSEVVRQNLEDLRDRTQADSMTEVIRRALAVYELLWDEKTKGAKLVLRAPDGEKEVILL